MRILSAALLATALTISGAATAFSAETGAALAPGKPAGVQQAELGTIGTPLLAIAGLIGFAAVLYSVSHSDSTPTAAPVVTSTSTSP